MIIKNEWKPNVGLLCFVPTDVDLHAQRLCPFSMASIHGASKNIAKYPGRVTLMLGKEVIDSSDYIIRAKNQVYKSTLLKCMAKHITYHILYMHCELPRYSQSWRIIVCTRHTNIYQTIFHADTLRGMLYHLRVPSAIRYYSSTSKSIFISIFKLSLCKMLPGHVLTRLIANFTVGERF